MSVNKYLEGNYAPVAEELTTFDLPVIGQLPQELNGRYLRNGPNPLHVADPVNHHWFLGDGMVHGVRLGDGKALWYRNRYVGSKALSQHRNEDDIAGPNWNDSATGPNTNVGGFAGTTWAMVEAGGTPVELTYELETIGRNDFSERSLARSRHTRRWIPTPARCMQWSTPRPVGSTMCNTSWSAPTAKFAKPSTFRFRP